MKITHNKVGQNLNLVDSAKQDRASGIGKSTDAKLGALDKLGETKNAGGGDEASRVELSPRAQDAKRIKEIAMQTPDVDEAKVAKFRKLIDEGNYKVDAKSIADKMVDEHLDF
jgi:negative regulator of flagellin synthesis FlgM